MAVTASQAGEKVALIIGNSAYKHAGILTNPTNDASAIAAQLKKIGFDKVELALDQTYNEMRRAIRKFAHLARKADIAMIYYAGHGIELSGRNFLVPTDAKLASDADVDYEAIPMQQLMDSVEGARKTGILVLDACRNNPFASKMVRTRGLTRSVSRGLADIEPSNNLLVAYSAKHGTVAEDGDNDNSPYTTALLKYMAVPGLDIQLMFRKVRDDVLKATSNRQQPFTYGSIGGTELPLFPGKKEIIPADTLATPQAATDSNTDNSEKSASLTNSEIEVHFWDAVKDSKSAEMLQSYLDQYPSGHFTKIASLKINMIKQQHANQQRNTPKPVPQRRPVHKPLTRSQTSIRTLSASQQQLAKLRKAVSRAKGCRNKKCLCDRYGRLSARQHQLNTKNKCGFPWPTWHGNANAHRTWCYGLFTAMSFVKSELGKRNNKLARCLN